MVPRRVHPEGQPLQLFRSEALAQRQAQWLGTVMLAPRASFRIFTDHALVFATIRRRAIDQIGRAHV